MLKLNYRPTIKSDGTVNFTFIGEKLPQESKEKAKKLFVEIKENIENSYIYLKTIIILNITYFGDNECSIIAYLSDTRPLTPPNKRNFKYNTPEDLKNYLDKLYFKNNRFEWLSETKYPNEQIYEYMAIQAC